MVFGVSLKFPGDFLSPSNNSFWPNPLNYVERLRSHMENLQALFTRPVSNLIFIPTDLKLVSMVLQIGEKTFTILQKGKESLIYIDRIKPAHLDKRVIENPSLVFHPNPPVKKTEKPISVTHSGRNMCLADRYKI
ncbi:unnamed protein product [Hymenolepis diminuta]|uniref:Uncharacterized protein n=1 Tax=Hymenolepis diminuta TaxID=6216 RepID=A0A564XUV4_HYMDI|nr:unnamed protein product [Hymenolepis diminuta]